MLAVGFGGDVFGGADDVSSVTYNGVALTLIEKSLGLTAGRLGYLYYLLAPATGANNVVITFSSSHNINACAESLTGVAQTAQPDNHTQHLQALGSTSETTSLTTIADNCWTVLVEQGYENGPAATAGTGLTRRAACATFGDLEIFDSGGAITPAQSYSMTTNRGALGAGTPMTHMVASFAPVASSSVGPLTGGGSLLHGRLLRGGRLVPAPSLWMPERFAA